MAFAFLASDVLELHASDSTEQELTVRCDHGCVVSVSAPASDAGVAILKQGGNAIDSAVATAFALAVTHPAAGNIGGGGYLLYAPAQGKPLVFDFREVASAAAERDMFVDPKQRTPHRRVGVPGTVRGLALAHAKAGKLKWIQLVRPAIALAEEGFLLDKSTAESLNELLKSSDPKPFAELHRVYGRADGKPWRAGDRLVQPDLAKTLKRIAEQGSDGFYLGETAELIAAEMQRGGGLVTTKDLAAYSALVREPLVGTYRGHEIFAVPPSSSGGTTLIEMLNILECFQLEPRRDAPQNIHLMVEAMKRAYRDRAAYLGDPEANDLPTFQRSKAHAKKLATSITDQATPSRDLAGDIPIKEESDHTTHFSVVDKDRNAVSLTYTLENSYGSRVVVPGAGFILNDEMNDFNWLPGVTDTQGRIGTDANLVRPGRRMLSSMCPTIVKREGKVLLVTGSPGGRTIINTVLGVVTNVIDFKMEVRAAVDAPRLHHAWYPDAIRMEPAWKEQSPELAGALRKRGHKFDAPQRQGDAHTIWIDPQSGELVGAADRRIQGHASGY
jgi:gamma-glutamyltranspeptidase/glutathione hydrolase